MRFIFLPQHSSETLKQHLIKSMTDKIDLQPMIESMTTLLCTKFPATVDPIPLFSEKTKQSDAFFEPLTKATKWIDGTPAPGFLNEFANAIFVQDIILSHMMASAEVADFIREYTFRGDIFDATL